MAGGANRRRTNRRPAPKRSNSFDLKKSLQVPVYRQVVGF
jgi:hypothetical protein